MRPHEAVELARGYRLRGRAPLEHGEYLDDRHEPELVIATHAGAGGPRCAGTRNVPLGQVRASDESIIVDDCTYRAGDIQRASLQYRGTPAMVRGGPLPDFDWKATNHRGGVQLGGPNFLLLTYQGRIGGPLFLQAGGFGLNGLLAFSLGPRLELPLSEWHAVHFGAGGSVAAAIGESDEHYFQERAFVYGLLGVTTALDEKNLVAADIGFWRGRFVSEHGESRRTETFTWPMAGLSWQVAL